MIVEDEIRAEHNFEEIIGNSARLKAVLESVRIVAPADSTVLIQGGKGTSMIRVCQGRAHLSLHLVEGFPEAL